MYYFYNASIFGEINRITTEILASQHVVKFNRLLRFLKNIALVLLTFPFIGSTYRSHIHLGFT